MASRTGRIKKFRRLMLIQLIVIVILLALLVWALISRYSMKEKLSSASLPGTGSDSAPTGDSGEKDDHYALDGRKIFLSDNTYGEIFLPVYADVPEFSKNRDNIISRNGYDFYKENGEITSIPGIDVSVHQGNIDWEKVKEAGIEFAMIRVGYRTYGGGEIKLDESFAENLDKADKAGIKTGVYFFSQATSVEEAQEEANTVIEAIKPYNVTYPVVYDWEVIYDDKARTDDLSVDVLNDCCIAFCDSIKSAGYTPMIYQNKRATLFKLDLPRLRDYDFWLAEYGEKPTYFYDFQMWQYSNTGKIPGIDGEVDLNICFRDYSK